MTIRGSGLVSIAPQLSFLDVLAGRLASRDDLADCLVMVPTRRAARGLVDAFLRVTDGRPSLLPRVVALGGMDEAPLALSGALSVPPAVGRVRRQAVLARLILALDGQAGAPSGADRAWPLADELATLLDEAQRAEVDLAERLPGLVDEDVAEHWQQTLRFLEIVTRHWPDWLAGEGLTDPVRRQIALLDAQSRAWLEAPPSHPVIVAGTTGAIPAVARLLRVVSRLPAGEVVLPGLDTHLSDEAWAALDVTHPQASLARLLVDLDARPGDVEPVEAASPPVPAARPALLSLAMLPAVALGAWRAMPAAPDPGLFRIMPADSQEEAVAIALILRDAIETPGHRAALVTPDRDLARRVAGELLRFGVVADDSAGEALADTPPAIFLRLLAQAAAEAFAPIPLLSLLKHPYCTVALDPGECRREARALERACLRGPRPEPGFAGLRRAGADARFLDWVEWRVAPLAAMMRLDRVDLRELLDVLVASAELLTERADRAVSPLWGFEEGEALAKLVADLREALPVLPPQPPDTLLGVLEGAMAGLATRTRRALRGRHGAEHPRVSIWGLLEARLQSVETMVLGGLTEAIWPETADPGPWLSRAMRAKVGLASPEERIGLAAHDFVGAACSAPVVVLSAPAKRDGAPCVASRWLVRLEALLGGRAPIAVHPAVGWARALDRPVGPPRPVAAPAPMPPVAARPRALSVTEIETWLKDPYAIYARHVLRLKRLDPIDQAAMALEYGKVVHAGLERFLTTNGAAWPDDAARAIDACMQEALADMARGRVALLAWWGPRLRRVAAWVAETGARRRAERPASHVAAEVKGAAVLSVPGGDFTLKARADAIERGVDGRIALLDYKTGQVPSHKAVGAGWSPQLLLEGAIAALGGFGHDLAGEIAELTYWKVGGGYEPGEVQTLMGGDALKLRAAAADAWTKLGERVRQFDDPMTPYLAQPHPGQRPRFPVYGQLARIAEWGAMIADDGGEPEEGDAS